MTTDKQKSRSILSMNADEAREFLLEERSYCRIDLPPYFKFEPILHNVSSIMVKKQMDADKLKIWKAGDHENVNYLITDNKDGRYAWRPMEIIHPVLYVSLVNAITDNKSWRFIIRRFSKFHKNTQISCHSIPVKSLSEKKNQAEQVSIWWKEIEQRSVELSLSYDHVIHTDISDCYGSIYTHSIAWALHGKQVAKSNKADYSLIGNEIDRHTRSMRNGQTNGIPQGSVLFDFISEMVLGYADLMLSENIKKYGAEDWYILRYRDDYRIFTNNTQTGEAILKILTEILIGLGLKLNSSKTQPSQNLVKAAIKDDKWNWIGRKQSDKNLLTHLLIIHSHGDRFPNSGSLIKALSKFFKRVCARNQHDNVLPLIGVAVDIAVKNPRTYSVVAAILSHLLASLDHDKQKDVLEKVRNKFSNIPNTSHMDIWMQRFTYFIDRAIPYQPPLCKLVANESNQLWCSDWVQDKALAKAINPIKIVDNTELDNLNPLIQNDEIDLYLLES